jgi:hypothetical protein
MRTLSLQDFSSFTEDQARELGLVTAGCRLVSLTRPAPPPAVPLGCTRPQGSLTPPLEFLGGDFARLADILRTL